MKQINDEIMQRKLKKVKQRLPVLVRLAEPIDEDFIIATWRDSFRTDNKSNVYMPWSMYKEEFIPLATETVRRTGAILAINPHDHDQLYGHLVGEYLGDTPVVHYIYVKQAFRKMGIANLLLDTFCKDQQPMFSCFTRNMRFFYKRKLLCNPYVFFRAYRAHERKTIVEYLGAES